MNVLDRKLVRDLSHARGLIAAVLLIITVGVAGFVAFLSVYFNLELARRGYYARCRMADFWVDIEKFPLHEMDRLGGIAGISEIRSRAAYPVRVDINQSDKPITGLLLSMPDQPQSVINGLMLIRGGYFTDARREEVIVHEAFARARAVGPGDRLHVFVKGRRQELHVVGTAISSEFVMTVPPGALLPDNERYGIFYVKRSFAEELLDMQGAANQVVGILTPEFRKRPQLVLDQIKQVLSPYGEATSTPLRDQHSHFALSMEIMQQRTQSLILPTIFLIVAASILNLLMMRIAEQQRTVVGTLKAVGYGNRTLLMHYLNFGLLVGVLGGLAGVALGYGLAGLLTELERPFFEFPNLKNRPYPLVALPCLLLSVACAMLGTLRGVRMVLRLTPAEAMRPKAPPSARRVALERARALWKHLDFRWQMAIRNIFRHRIRTFTSVFAAAIGTMLVLTTLHLVDSLGELLRFTYDKMLLSDFELQLEGQQPYDALLETRRLPGVDYAEPMFVLGCTLANGHHREKTAVTGLKCPSRLTALYDDARRRMVLPEHGIVLTDELARTLNAHAGDVVSMIPVIGRRVRLRVPVQHVATSFVGSGAFADIRYLNALMGEVRAMTNIQLKNNPDPGTARRFYRELKGLANIKGYSSTRDEKAHLLELLGPFRVSVVVLILFAGLIFCGSLLNASLISLSERQQEVATLRVLGYYPRELSGMFLRQTLCVNTIGIVVGLPLGYGLSRLMGTANATELLRFPFVISARSWLLTVVLGFVFTLVAHLPVRTVIKNMDWLSSINVKE